MKLNKIKPRLAVLSSNRLPVLDTKAGATPRTRGSTWMTTRRRIMLRDKYTCAGCGLVRADHDVDHMTPLEHGGADDDSNLQLLCRTAGTQQGCHDRKTAEEARGRGGSNV